MLFRSAGIDFPRLAPAAIDLPMGFKTGAGVIFGTTGGVSEAVLRYAYEALTGKSAAAIEFRDVRGEAGRRCAAVRLGETELRLVVVHSLQQAKKVAEEVAAGRLEADLVEVMACPGGCVGGAGQPVTTDPEVRRARAAGLYDADRNLQLHASQDNPFIKACYAGTLDGIGGPKAHGLLHTQIGRAHV